MTDRPILFSGPMVKAILEGRKSMTRRVLKPQPEALAKSVIVDKTRITDYAPVAMFRWANGDRQDIHLPHAIGDRLWVGEEHLAWGHWETTDELTKTGKQKRRFVRDWSRPVEFKKPMSVQSDKFDHNTGFHARRGRFMFRADSRLTLAVDDVRVQRLQDISEADARAEGSFLGRCPCPQMQAKPRDPFSALFRQTGCHIHGDEFSHLWNSIHGPDAWDANPWVMALTFTPHPTNIDQMGGE